jgi:hypothetical protein
MFRALRRCRNLALTLLLAAPGLGGTWLSVAHPCPVDAPWLAQVGHGDHGAQTSHGHGNAPADSSTSCNCVGACHSGAAALISISTGPTAILAAVGWNTSPSSPNSDTPVQPRLRRHPPATAPPLA